MRVILAVVAVAAVAAVSGGLAPPASAAATASLVSGTLTVTADAADDSLVLQEVRAGLDVGIGVGAGTPVVPGPGCRAARPTAAQCLGAVTSVVVSLGAGDDQLTVVADPADVGVTEQPPYAGGPVLPRFPPLTADAGPGDDFVSGSHSNDTLSGGPGRDVIYGYGGDDTIDGGAGSDVLYGDGMYFSPDPDIGFYRGPFGDDRLLVRDGESDRVECGAGIDTVIGDPKDAVPAHPECETQEGTEPFSATLDVPRARFAALVAGGAMRVPMTCSKACTYTVSLTIPAREARRLGLPSNDAGRLLASDTNVRAGRKIRLGAFFAELRMRRVDRAAVRANLRRHPRAHGVLVARATDAGDNVVTIRRPVLLGG